MKQHSISPGDQNNRLTIDPWKLCCKQRCGSGSWKRLNFCGSGSTLKKEAGSRSKLGSNFHKTWCFL